jgi:hypothetical protein
MKNHFAHFLSEPNKTKLGASPYPIFLLSCRNSEMLKYASAEAVGHHNLSRNYEFFNENRNDINNQRP